MNCSVVVVAAIILPSSTYGWKGSTAAKTRRPVCGSSDLLMSCSSCRGSSQRSSRFRQLIRSYWKPVRCHSSIPSKLEIQSQAQALNHLRLSAFLVRMHRNENSWLKPKPNKMKHWAEGWIQFFKIFPHVQWHAKVWEPLVESVKMWIILTK